MKTTFAITESGAIVITVPTSEPEEFEQAREKVLAAFEQLGQTCPEIKQASDIEQHSHGPEKGHVHISTNA